jgi:hypothetical protein
MEEVMKILMVLLLFNSLPLFAGSNKECRKNITMLKSKFFDYQREINNVARRCRNIKHPLCSKGRVQFKSVGEELKTLEEKLEETCALGGPS